MSRYTVISEDEAYVQYNEILDAEHEYGIMICNVTFDASKVLKEMDPIAYDEGFNDFVDLLVDDGILVEDRTDHLNDEENE